VSAATREELLGDLFTAVSDAVFDVPIMGHTTWAGKARKYVDPAQIPNGMQPFLAQFEGFPEHYERRGMRLPPVREIGVRLFCWARVDTGDTAELGSQYLTTMLEAVERVMLPDLAGYGAGSGNVGLFTLNGGCQWCRIEGSVLKIPGDTDGQALVCIPVRILWP
jgi:hypothetical protein